MTDDTHDLREEVRALRERVSALERRLDRADDETPESDATSGGEHDDVYDRYDEQVLDQIGDVESAHPRQLMQAYERVGVIDKKKQKQRAKRLKRLAEQGGGHA